MKKLFLFLVVFTVVFLLAGCGGDSGGGGKMALIEGGTFMMGSLENEPGRDYDELQHEVEVDSFYISDHEVTQGEWQAVMGNGVSRQRNLYDPNEALYGRGDNLPIYYVSWYEALEYCNALSQKEELTPVYTIVKVTEDPNNLNHSGYDDPKWLVSANWNADGYRLPTEAEWEYAARGGKESKGYLFAGGEDWQNIGWYQRNSGDVYLTDVSAEKRLENNNMAQAVMQKSGNELGLFDMSGNVAEWCWDWYDGYGEESDRLNNPRGAGEGSNRSVRGGSWRTAADSCRTAYRGSVAPYARSSGLGFRVARSVTDG